MNIHITSQPVKLEFMEHVKIVELYVGDSHNLMLAEDGSLYANGDNSAGQIDGVLDNFMYYNCSPIKITLPSKSSIKSIKAKNNRSAAMMEDGNIFYWGGFSYHPKYRINYLPKYDGFNIFNVEPGLPKDPKITDFCLGIFHDILIVNE